MLRDRARRSPSWRSRSTRLSDSLPLFALARRRRRRAGTSCSRWAAACRRASWPHAWATAGPTPATASRRARSGRPAARASSQFRRIRPDAALYGVVGKPIGALAVAGRCTTPASPRSDLNAVYVPLEARDVDDFVAFARDAVAGAARASRRRSRSTLMAYVDEIDADRQARRRGQHARRPRRPLDRREHRRRRLPRAARRPHAAARHARVRSRRRRRGAGGCRCARRDRARRSRSRARRPDAAQRGRASSSAGVPSALGRRRPAAGTSSSTRLAGQQRPASDDPMDGVAARRTKSCLRPRLRAGRDAAPRATRAPRAA